MAYLPQLVGEGRAQEAGGPQFQANTYDDICDCSCISLEHLNLKITTFYNIYIYTYSWRLIACYSRSLCAMAIQLIWNEEQSLAIHFVFHEGLTPFFALCSTLVCSSLMLLTLHQSWIWGLLSAFGTWFFSTVFCLHHKLHFDSSGCIALG